MKRFLTLTLLAGIILSATAQKRVVVSLENSGADEIVHYWDNSTAPHSNEITEDEQMNKKFDMRLTSSTDFYIYKADPAKATGQGVVIVPGGGYYKLSMKYDGFMIGQYLRSIGVSAIVVKYRLPNNGHREVPLEDAQAGLRYMRTEGAKWGVDPQQVGILGSSAGGYLAGHASNVTPDNDKPAFSILIYSVVDGTKRSPQRGSFGLMLGTNRTDAEQESYSLHNLVSPTTPPALLLLADDDLTVKPEHSMAYYKALKHYGIPSAVHVFPSGGHGWAGHDEWQYAEPCKRAIKDWLQIMQNLKTK